MKKKLFKWIIVIITPILVLTLLSYITLNNVPDYLYSSKDIEVMSIDVGPLNTLSYNKNNNKMKVNLLGIIPVKTIALHKVDDIYVTPGGNSVGVRLSSNGVLVVGYSEVVTRDGKDESPAQKGGIEIGDLITKVNNEEVKTSKDLISKIEKCKSNTIKLEISRDNTIITKEICPIKEENDKYKLGIWVRDSTSGVGTLTFYDSETGKFGALGHPVTDGDTNKLFSIGKGDILESSIISVKKGEKGSPGELRGVFIEEENPIGTIDKNTQCGIFGCNKEAIEDYNNNEPMKVGFRDEIKLGKAKIITTVDESGPKEYEIEILKLFTQEEPSAKSMIIKITDEELLAKTGGIVQGMSGSPIIQDNKIVGAVTHVLINKPDVGYGVYIDWMLEDAGILK